MKVAYCTGFWCTNIGNGFFSLGVEHVLKKVLGEKKNADDAALTLYFCNKGEDLWDIAKKYNTTKEAVCLENSISGDVTEKDDMILIPWVG